MMKKILSILSLLSLSHSLTTHICFAKNQSPAGKHTAFKPLFNSQKGNRNTLKLKSAILAIDENCSNCDELIKKLEKKCKTFSTNDFNVLATGNKSKLESKLRKLNNKGVRSFFSVDIEDLLSLGVESIPTYISPAGTKEIGVEDSFNALVKAKVCKI
jgi:hypothetical protein